VGRSQSFFDLVTYGGAYSYHNVRVSGDTGASGENLWAYTAQFGNGFSGTLSLEDPATRKLGTLDVTQASFFGLGAIANDNGLTINPTFGFRVPDIIANLRVDQAWGFAGISAALHDVSGAYYNTPNLDTAGHPADKYGWAVAGGAKFNLQGGDAMGFNVCYTQGAPGFCTNNNFFQVYNSNTSVALGWVADGIFTGTAAGGSQVELTTAWSALAFYEHIWNPKWRTAVGGGYVNVDYNANATTAILQKTLGAAAACNVAAVGAATTVFTLTPGNGCNPDVSFWEAYMRTQWNPWRSSISVSKFCTRGVTPPSRVQASSRSTARVLRSSSSTTRTSGLAWCAGSVTSIHDGLLSHHGFNLQTLGGKPPRVLL
jgi:Porin subfamily